LWLVVVVVEAHKVEAGVREVIAHQPQHPLL
jgi:hypothetical protein